MRARALPLLLLTAGCVSTTQPEASFLAGLRVVGIVAQPPQVGPGETSTVTVFAVDTTGATPTATWQRCLLPPLPGQAVNPDCITNQDGPDLEPVGAGLQVSFTMPATALTTLGAPDSTGGRYVPLIARAASGAQVLISDYRLRLTEPGQTPNQNPTIASVIVASGDAGVTVLDEATPFPVHVGDKLALGVTFAPGSAETYTVTIEGAPTRTVTETLTTSWFSTAGELSNKKTSDMQPTTLLQLNKRLPASGARIDIYAVSRDERGGTDVAHRVLELQ